MNNFLFWQRWLMIVGVVVVLFGTVMALLNGTVVFDIFNDQINPVFWSDEGQLAFVDTFQQWVYGAWGATVAGWGIVMVFIANYPFKRQERWARNSLIAGVSFWYVLDTGISLYYRVYFNAIFNTTLLILVAIPLTLTWKYFRRN
jgi:hypothetical protein